MAVHDFKELARQNQALFKSKRYTAIATTCTGVYRRRSCSCMVC
jgi:hypothetical protein